MQRIEEFGAFIAGEKKYSSHTLKSYLQDLRDFKDYLRSQYMVSNPLEIKPTYIRSWLASMSAAGMESSSLNRKLSTLKSFFKFIKGREPGMINPMRKIVSPKNKKALPKFVTSREMETMLVDNETEAADYFTELPHFMVQLFYETGIRCSEMASIRLQDINTAGNSIKVLGKGNKQRIIPVRAELMVKIMRFINIRKDVDNIQCDHLIITPRGMKAYPKYIYNLVHKVLERNTSAQQKSPHVLRHTFATHLADNGAEINAIKALLGHSSLKATQVYTHNSIQKIREVYVLAHPRAQKK